MGDRMKFVELATCRVKRYVRGLLGCDDGFRLGGVFHVRCVAPDGTVRWEDTAENLVTNTALNDVLNVYFRATSGPAAWYMGLVDNASFSAYSGADTAASHVGWLENQNYSNSTRPQWSPGAASSQSITNGSTVNFNMTATATIRGLFINTNNTVGGTTGILGAEASFSGGNQAVNNGDTLQCTYTMSVATN